MIVALWAVLGWAAAVALNHLADRLPRHARLSTPPTCRQCGGVYRPAQWPALAAVLLGKGRCAQCGRQLPARRWLFEIGLPLVYGLLAWRYPLSWTLVVATFHASVLSLITVTDLEERKVPDAAVFPGMAVAVAVALLRCPRCLPGTLLGGLVAFAFFLALTLFHMGLGDVTLAGYVGLIAGYPRVLVCLLVAILAGGVGAAGLLLSGKVSRREYMPYAPYLALGGALALLSLP